jgi:hypothetical protein
MAIASIAGIIAGAVANVAFGVVAGALAAVVGIVKACDTGKGIYLTMLWVTPGFFVPTTVV